MRAFLTAVFAAALLAPATAGADVIVGGAETEKEWPFMGYIETARQELELGDGQFCAASLIAPTWAMTAAHCVTIDPLVDPVITTFVIGRHAKSDTGAGERIQVKRMVIHESYGDPAADSNDVVLMELERAPANAQPIKIAGAAEEELWATGDTSTLLGWGAVSEGGSGSDVLKEAQVPIVADADCAKSYGGDFDPGTMVCAGYPQGGTDTCQGDSGGPLIVPAADGTWRQAGITSWGDGCARADRYGVYTRIAGASLRDWVAGIVPDAVSKASAGAPAPAPSPAPSSAPAPSGGDSGAPASQPVPSSTTSDRAAQSAAAKRAAAKRRKAAAARKRACIKKAKRIKSASKRKRAIRRCNRKR